MEGPAAQAGGSTGWKSHRLVTVLKAYEGRSAIEATERPPKPIAPVPLEVRWSDSHQWVERFAPPHFA
jgi:hypothetical protein